MYYVTCNCTPTAGPGGQLCHATNCDIRQLASRQQPQQQLRGPSTTIAKCEHLPETISSATVGDVATPADCSGAPDGMSFTLVTGAGTHPRISLIPSVPVVRTVHTSNVPATISAGASVLTMEGVVLPQASIEESTLCRTDSNPARCDSGTSLLKDHDRNDQVFTKSSADWSDADVKALFDVYETERSKFITRGLVSRKLWDEVAVKINSQTGGRFKGCHCENKWKVLMRGYRRAERDKSGGSLSPEQFKNTYPLYDRIQSILRQEAPRNLPVSVKDANALSREERQVWNIADSRRLLRYYARLRQRDKAGSSCVNLPQTGWTKVADLIKAENVAFAMNGSHCYSRFRFLRIKYQRAMMLLTDEASRRATCPLFDELHSALSADPLPERAPLTPSQASKKRKSLHEQRSQRVAESETADGGVEVSCTSNQSPSVIHLESVRTPNSEFTAYLARLVDGLAPGPLRDKAMQDILKYIFKFRKNVRLAKATTPAPW